MKVGEKVTVTICKSGGYFSHYKSGIVKKVTVQRIGVDLGSGKVRYFVPHNVSRK